MVLYITIYYVNSLLSYGDMFISIVIIVYLKMITTSILYKYMSNKVIYLTHTILIKLYCITYCSLIIISYNKLHIIIC